MHSHSFDIGVIGGGASGLMAAISAAGQGKGVAVFERLDRVGKKLLATGNGRCNLTCLNLSPERFHSGHPSGVQSVLRRFGLKETLAFFESIGLVWKSDPEGRIFPVTDQSSTVLDLLRQELLRFGVQETCGAEVTRVQNREDGFRVHFKNRQTGECRNLVLAAGGRAAPNLGSNGSGHVLAQSMGHRVVEPWPAVVQICLNVPFLNRLKGIRIDAAVSLADENGILQTEEGEILFTEYGLSGIPTLNLSRRVQPMRASGKTPHLMLDLFPHETEDRVRDVLLGRMQKLHYKTVEESLIGFLHKRVAAVMLALAGLDPKAKARQFEAEAAGRLARQLKHWMFQISGTKSWSEAQVTAGGVRLDEVDTDTLESKIVPGLFLAGEILDVDGDCGGYNLQWAWSSGRVAGQNAGLASGSRRSK